MQSNNSAPSSSPQVESLPAEPHGAGALARLIDPGVFWFRVYPIVAKVGGLQSQGAQGRSRSRSTANPWQRRIWSPPAFPQGKKMAENRPDPQVHPG